MQLAIQKEPVYPAGSRGDEGRINWHSGGERWRESDGDPADGHTLTRSIHPSLSFLFFSVNDCTVCFLEWVEWWEQEEVEEALLQGWLVSMVLIVIKCFEDKSAVSFFSISGFMSWDMASTLCWNLKRHPHFPCTLWQLWGLQKY